MFRSRNALSKESRWTTEPPSGSDVTYSWGDALILEPVLDDGRREIDDTAPPASPAVGDRYIIGPNATGDWTGGTNKITEWNGTDWSTQQYPFQEIYNLYGTALGVGGDRGVLVYCRKRAQYLQYTKVEQQDLVEPLATEVLLRTSGVAAASNYMTWLPLHEANSLHSAFKNPVDSVDVATGSWGTPYIYQRRIVPAGAPAPYNAHIGHIGIWAPISSAAAGAWVFNKPTEGELVWVADKNKFYYYNGTTWVPLGNNIDIDDLASVVITGLAGGDTIQYDGANWVNVAAPAPGAHTLDSHSDVDTTGVGIGDVLTYDGADWVAGAGGGAHALNGHTDTNLGAPGAPEDGYVVAWDNGTSKYVLQAPSAPGAHTLDSHSNVTITAVAANHKIRWNGSAWVNVLDNLDSLTDVVISGAALGDVLYYNGTNWVNSNLATLTSHNHTLDSLSNVSTGGKAVGDFLWWTGTAWANRGIRLDDLYDVSAPAPAVGNALVWNGSAWAPGSPSATVTAEWGYFYSSGGGFLTGGASGVTLDTGYTPNRFIVGSTGKWMIVVHTNANSPDVEISTSAGGVTQACTFGNTAIAALTSGQYFTISAGPNPVGNKYSVSIMKVGN